MLENVRNLSPEEILNYIEMPEAASRAINELMDQVAELEATVESLENAKNELNTFRDELAAIIKQARVNYDSIIPDLQDLINSINSSL
jgi:cell division protein FtsB